jgi:predicted TIM-barrel fold metal-dependent hydrolase
MRERFLVSVALLSLAGCGYRQPAKVLASSPNPTEGPFTREELLQFSALNPIDAHTHIYQASGEFNAMLDKLHLHVIDILVAHTPDQKDLDAERQEAWNFVHSSSGHASLCSTFEPFPYREKDFAQKAEAEINADFDEGAIAVKIWKNIGEQVKDEKGNYILADNPVFEPIYKDIAAHNKTLIAHQADPNTIWEPPNPAAPDYAYYMHHPEWYMYGKPNAPSKEAILKARDHMLEENPDLRVVGAHVGSMEANFKELGEHLDRYPNFAVDMAARMPYFVMQPRAKIIAFIEKYQDKLIYGTDDDLDPGVNAVHAVEHWEQDYAFDWRFLATDDLLPYKGQTVQGLALPEPILRKIYHDNAVHWFPGVLADANQGRN